MARPPRSVTAQKPVIIYNTGDSLTVVPNRVPISIQKQEQVHWFLSGEGSIVSITFKKNHPAPFCSDHNSPVLHRDVLSDVVKDGHHGGHVFRYTVVVATAPDGKQLSLDPEVHVQPYPLDPKAMKRGRKAQRSGGRRHRSSK
jgi:hypothetical protein